MIKGIIPLIRNLCDIICNYSRAHNTSEVLWCIFPSRKLSMTIFGENLIASFVFCNFLIFNFEYLINTKIKI